MTRALLPTAVCFALAVPAFAQPTLSIVPDVVQPGASITVTISGPPGQQWALVGSSTGSGFTYGGVALSVGLDVRVEQTGILDGSGQVTVTFTPPFRGSVLDRYYLQAATSPSPNFIPLAVSAGRIVRNADLVS